MPGMRVNHSRPRSRRRHVGGFLGLGPGSIALTVRIAPAIITSPRRAQGGCYYYLKTLLGKLIRPSGWRSAEAPDQALTAIEVDCEPWTYY